MPHPPKDTRTPAEKALDTECIIGSMIHEGYVATPETEAIHARAERGEITTEQLIELFRERGSKMEADHRATVR